MNDSDVSVFITFPFKLRITELTLEKLVMLWRGDGAPSPARAVRSRRDEARVRVRVRVRGARSLRRGVGVTQSRKVVKRLRKQRGLRRLGLATKGRQAAQEMAGGLQEALLRAGGLDVGGGRGRRRELGGDRRERGRPQARREGCCAMKAVWGLWVERGDVGRGGGGLKWLLRGLGLGELRVLENGAPERARI